jgi:predicted site-specific integrase-resolvase
MHTQQHSNRTASIHPRAYSLAQVAAILGIHRATAHRLVQAGKLKAISGFGVLKISDTEINRFLNTTEQYKPKREVLR